MHLIAGWGHPMQFCCAIGCAMLILVVMENGNIVIGGINNNDRVEVWLHQ